MADKEAEEEEDDAPDSEDPASEEPETPETPPEKPPAETEPKAEAQKVDAEPDKPVSKSVEWGLAIAMMVILVGFLLLMIHFMRSARSAVM